MDPIVVCTHPRSGTHFLINSLCANLGVAEFSEIRGGFATLESLILPHDKAFAEEWLDCLENEDGRLKIFKTHLTPTDIEIALDLKWFLSPLEREILGRIYENGRFLNIYRDGRDVMVSWYHYQKDAGGGLPVGTKIRLAQCGFSEFLRMPNKYYMPIRGFQEEDKNHVTYWAAHLEGWLQRRSVTFISYEALLHDFEETLKSLSSALGLEDHLPDKLWQPSLPLPRTGYLDRLVCKIQRGLGIKTRKEKVRKNTASARKGISGDWKNYFNENDLEFFLEYGGRVMKRLNYV